MAVRTVTARCGRRLFCTSSVPPPTAVPSTSVFVSGLDDSTNSEGLREAFSHFGKVRYAQVMADSWHPYSLGFAYVRYETVEEAAKAIKGMDGKLLDGSKISAEYARPKTPSELRSSVVPWKWSKQLNYF